jgi:probable rRNA maturation factor
VINVQLPEYPNTDIDADRVRQAAQRTVASQRSDEVDLTIVFVNNERIRTLNATYRGLDEPTDVLSFPDDQIDPDTNHLYIGDVIISVETAQVQAEKYGHSLLDEIRLLVVHGALHLLGFDHATQAEKDSMWTVQASVLDQLGLAGIHIPDDHFNE